MRWMPTFHISPILRRSVGAIIDRPQYSRKNTFCGTVVGGGVLDAPNPPSPVKPPLQGEVGRAMRDSEGLEK